MLMVSTPLRSEDVPPCCCIYRIVHADGKQYVGQTQNLRRRLKEHARAANQTLISRAIRKHGADSFIAEILEMCDPADLDAKEKSWIDRLASMAPDGFNLRSGGRESEHLSAESRKKISQRLSGRKFSQRHIDNLSAAHIGKIHTDASRARMSASHSGQKRSESAKAAMSAGQQRRRARWREEQMKGSHVAT